MAVRESVTSGSVPINNKSQPPDIERFDPADYGSDPPASPSSRQRYNATEYGDTAGVDIVWTEPVFGFTNGDIGLQWDTLYSESAAYVSNSEFTSTINAPQNTYNSTITLPENSTGSLMMLVARHSGKSAVNVDPESDIRELLIGPPSVRTHVFGYDTRKPEIEINPPGDVAPGQTITVIGSFNLPIRKMGGGDISIGTNASDTFNVGWSGTEGEVSINFGTDDNDMPITSAPKGGAFAVFFTIKFPSSGSGRVTITANNESFERVILEMVESGFSEVPGRRWPKDTPFSFSMDYDFTRYVPEIDVERPRLFISNPTIEIPGTQAPPKNQLTPFKHESDTAYDKDIVVFSGSTYYQSLQASNSNALSNTSAWKQLAHETYKQKRITLTFAWEKLGTKHDDPVSRTNVEIASVSGFGFDDIDVDLSPSLPEDVDVSIKGQLNPLPLSPNIYQMQFTLPQYVTDRGTPDEATHGSKRGVFNVCVEPHVALSTALREAKSRFFRQRIEFPENAAGTLTYRIPAGTSGLTADKTITIDYDTRTSDTLEIVSWTVPPGVQTGATTTASVLFSHPVNSISLDRVMDFSIPDSKIAVQSVEVDSSNPRRVNLTLSIAENALGSFTISVIADAISSTATDVLSGPPSGSAANQSPSIQYNRVPNINLSHKPADDGLSTTVIIGLTSAVEGFPKVPIELTKGTLGDFTPDETNPGRYTQVVIFPENDRGITKLTIKANSVSAGVPAADISMDINYSTNIVKPITLSIKSGEQKDVPLIQYINFGNRNIRPGNISISPNSQIEYSIRDLSGPLDSNNLKPLATIATPPSYWILTIKAPPGIETTKQFTATMTVTYGDTITNSNRITIDVTPADSRDIEIYHEPSDDDTFTDVTTLLDTEIEFGALNSEIEWSDPDNQGTVGGFNNDVPTEKVYSGPIHYDTTDADDGNTATVITCIERTIDDNEMLGYIERYGVDAGTISTETPWHNNKIHQVFSSDGSTSTPSRPSGTIANGGAFVGLSDMVKNGNDLYFVVQIQKRRKGGDNELAYGEQAGAALCHVDLSGSNKGQLTVLKRYAYYTQAARSLVKHNGKIYFFEGTHYADTRDGRRNVQRKNSNQRGNIYEIDGKTITYKGGSWRSDISVTEELKNEHRGYHFIHGGTLSPMVSTDPDGDNPDLAELNLITGHGGISDPTDDLEDIRAILDVVTTTVPPASHTGFLDFGIFTSDNEDQPAETVTSFNYDSGNIQKIIEYQDKEPNSSEQIIAIPDNVAADINNWNWIRYSRKLLQNITKLETNKKKAFDLIKDLASLTHSIIGYDNEKFFMRPRDPYTAELRTELTPSDTSNIMYKNRNRPFPDINNGHSDDTLILIDQELIKYTAVSDSEFQNITRAYQQTEKPKDNDGMEINHAENTKITKIDHVLDLEQSVIEPPINELNWRDDSSQLYNQVEIRYGEDLIYRDEDFQSIQENKELETSFEVPLDRHQLPWVRYLAKQFLQRNKDMKYLITLELKPTFYMRLGDVVLLRHRWRDRSKDGWHIFEPCQVYEISHSFSENTTTMVFRTI